MPTLSTAIARQPVIYQKRYGDSYWINWINTLLERLSGEGYMPLVDYERGFPVSNDVWINRPAGMHRIKKIWNPSNPDIEYGFKEVNNRIKLTDATVSEDEDTVALTTFANYATTSIDVAIDDAEEDEYENYLFEITAGTLLGNTYVIGNNDESDGGTATLYFLHTLSAALDGTKVTAAQLIHPTYYVMMAYAGSFEEVTAVSDEIPVSDFLEREIVDLWLTFQAIKNVVHSSSETSAAERRFEDKYADIRAERLSSMGPIRGRSIPGLRWKR